MLGTGRSARATMALVEPGRTRLRRLVARTGRRRGRDDRQTYRHCHDRPQAHRPPLGRQASVARPCSGPPTDPNAPMARPSNGYAGAFGGDRTVRSPPDPRTVRLPWVGESGDEGLPRDVVRRCTPVEQDERRGGGWLDTAGSVLWRGLDAPSWSPAHGPGSCRNSASWAPRARHGRPRADPPGKGAPRAWALLSAARIDDRVGCVS